MNLRSHRHLRRTLGFSLIELLIVVAIIAALVGVAVPMFQKNIAEAHRAKAQQDLDTIRNAITLHDSQNRPLIGTDLKPLLGRYLQEIPKDPWGNDYLLDAGMGLLISFGANQAAGGDEEDADLKVRYKSALKIQKAVYTGSWGLPAVNAQMRIQFNKPFEITDVAKGLQELVLVYDSKTGAVIPFSGGSMTAATGTPPNKAWGNVKWAFDASVSDTSNGLFVLKVSDPPADPPGDTIRLSPSMAVNIAGSVKATSPSTSGEIESNCAFREKFTPKGPCDGSIYGSGVLKADGAHPQESVGGENRGVTIERR